MYYFLSDLGPDLVCFRSEKRMPALKDADGNIFIDRDPDTFAVILTFLRTGVLDNELPCSMERLKVEADYFGIKGMTKIIARPGKKNANEPEIVCPSAECYVKAAECYEKLEKSAVVAVRHCLYKAAEEYKDMAGALRRK